MNIQMRLAAIAMLSIVSCDSAAALSICVDRRVAITIGELTQQASQLSAKGERAKAAPFKQMADQLEKAHCITVASYPPPRTRTRVRLGCDVFSGEARLPNGAVSTAWWNICP